MRYAILNQTKLIYVIEIRNTMRHEQEITRGYFDDRRQLFKVYLMNLSCFELHEIDMHYCEELQDALYRKWCGIIYHSLTSQNLDR